MYGNLSQQGLLTADELKIATLHVSRALNHVHAKDIFARGYQANEHPHFLQSSHS